MTNLPFDRAASVAAAIRGEGPLRVCRGLYGPRGPRGPRGLVLVDKPIFWSGFRPGFRPGFETGLDT